MNSFSSRSQMIRVIHGIENGTLSSADAYNILKDTDPVLVYFTLRFLKEKFGSDHQQAQPVRERLIELTSTYDDLRKILKLGEADSMREWFDDSHSIREFTKDSEGYIDLIIDKLDG